jgi:hypothetical protein
MSCFNKYLSREEQKKFKKIIEEHEFRVAEKISKQICNICLDTIIIPVTLNKDIFCNDCGEENAALCCLNCTRKWLQLNKPNYDRTPVKHLICNKQINTKFLNANRSYTIDHKLIKLIDEYFPKKIICDCKKEYDSRQDFYQHIGDGTCELSTFKCRFCNFRGKTAEIIRHYSRTDEEGCKVINNLKI